MQIGIDLGGTKIEAAALDSMGGMLARQRVATPRDDYQATIDAMVALVHRLESETGRSGTVGVGIPGAISPATGLIKNANSTWLIGRPLDRDLAEALARPVRLANDANCFTLSEATDGAAFGADVVFGVILGTGVGGGVVAGGRLLAGANAIGGEWGHNPLPWAQDDERPGADCYCGLQGCIETYLCGAGLVRTYGALSGAAAEDGLDAQQISERADADDSVAVTAVAQYAHRLARSLASVINVLDPDVIVLGGGLSNLELLYQRVPELWQDWVFSECPETRLVRNRHGDSSGVRGAAWLWPPDSAKAKAERA